ncbi:hypothetical protein D7030_08855 [Flavobacteriaceae bacterium AU392]|nr:hypothetical protein D1817_14860 [Flavobacteriaceae bacterium]RKM84128.1 hypothetical protein D7030_08855 [Flavobacteriaceae bacterium AU392]
MKKSTLLIVALFGIVFFGFAQEEEKDEGSVIQNLTPSQLIKKGQVDIKWFNNLFTQTRSNQRGGADTFTVPRENFFTSTLDAFIGVSDSRRINLGLVLEFRSNTIGGRGAFDVFQFDGESGTARSGLTSIAPSIKFVPFKNLPKFSIQTSFVIPLIESEFDNGVFFDQDGFTFQNRFFYDLPLGGNKWQLFFDLNTELNFGDGLTFGADGRSDGSFANDSLRLTPGVFLSFFPSSKFTIQTFIQHFQLIDLGNDFEQDLTAVGAGAKYQLTKRLNIETLWSYFARGNDTGLGESYNIGLRYVTLK